MDRLHLGALTAVADAIQTAEAVPGRAVLVRSAAGGGSALVGAAIVAALEARGQAAMAVESLERLPESEQLDLRRSARTHQLVIASEPDGRDAAPDSNGFAAGVAATSRLIAYLRPMIVDVPQLSLADTLLALVVASGRTDWTDEAAAAVQRATDGRLGDIVELAGILLPTHIDPASRSVHLTWFAPTQQRLNTDVPAIAAPSADIAAWAIATAEGVATVAATLWCPDGARPIDAAVIAAAAPPVTRADAMRLLCDRAGKVAGDLSPDERVTVARWWCDVVGPGDPLGGAELAALLPGVFAAFELHRWGEGRVMAERLWRTTGSAPAAIALATALGREAPTPVLDEVGEVSDADTQATVAFTRSLWQFYSLHEPELAAATLEAARLALTQQADLLLDGLATIDLHRGRPDDAERRVADRPHRRSASAGGDSDRRANDGGPTSFGVNTLVLADLVRGRHRRAIERLDGVLERHLDPGMNLTADRYRFFRAFVAAQAGPPSVESGTDDAEIDIELGRLYERSLHRTDDWNLGWTGWGAGLHDSRGGRFLRARRRLTASANAFERANRPGFASWPYTALAALDALVDEPSWTPIDPVVLSAPDHRVTFDRADAQLSLALLARRDVLPTRRVAELLRAAMTTAHDQREVVTSHRIAIEQLLAGIEPDEPIGDTSADGALVDSASVLSAASASAGLDRARHLERLGTTLIDNGWRVLGSRVLAHAAEAARRDDPRVATRLRQLMQATVATFDAPLRPWVLGEHELPVLSAREYQIANAIAGGAGRDEVADSLHISRRTVDSHLQRIYAKLGIGTRAELRIWLDR